MTVDSHHTRAHSVWSASATARNSVCAGAIAMSSLCEDVEREAAAWGTCCHEYAERCLRENLDPSIFNGCAAKSGKFSFEFDDEMENVVRIYVDYCRARIHEYWCEFDETPPHWIEHRLSLGALDPPLEAGGTGDFIIWFPKWKLLEVVDLKGGRGVVVDAVDNPQGRTYAIGALLSLPDVNPERIRVTIVQPRVGDGLPKSDEFHIVDLLDWTYDLLKLMQRAKDALDEFEACGGGLTKEWSDEADPPQWVTHVTFKSRMLFDEWADKWLTPGQCTFCTAKPICPALRKKALAAMPEIARKWHEDVTLTTPPSLTNLAKIGSVEELGHDLDGFDELEGWIKARRAYAHQQAEHGNPPTGYGLVDKIGNRAWKEKDANNLCCAIQDALNLKGNEILTPGEVKSVAQIEKALGKRKAELAKLEGVLWEKPIKGTNLVRLDKTTRPEAKSLAERFNETVETE